MQWMTTRRAHWEKVYADRDPATLSWYQENPARSLILIEETGVADEAPIIDIGGGASRLVDRLSELGYSALTVVDLAPPALAQAQERLGERARDVIWIDADVLDYPFAHQYAIWHDRAVFHFLTEPADRDRYVGQLESAVAPGGHVIIAGFSLDGPEQCSGLPVQRHSEETLTAALGDGFRPIGFQTEAHHTPGGATQHFLYGVFARRGD
ncbi:MAG: class I SAM-dependent methyltransferase [Acidimicrobiia bacterium]|nr:class I SAM-dependent methyltransferase [Acidimicrobiia bacterium]